MTTRERTPAGAGRRLWTTSSIADIRGSLTEERGVRLGELRRPGLRSCLAVAVLLGVAQQLSGAHTVLFCTPRVLTDTGFST